MPLTKAQAKSLDILEVARSLGMEMKRKSHREYYWAEHDSFKIDTVKNVWHWYSQADKYGDTISLVQEMRNVSYKEAMVFLETGSFPEAKPMEDVRKPFNYTLASHEQPFVEARTYLKEVRGLSDDTIDFFLEKGVLAQAKRKDKEGVIEDVLVFKYLDRNQQLVGASLQGLVPDQERHPGKGYLKQIMYQSESISGLNVSIGSPKRLIVAEAPIDLMSYYELYKGELNDVRLVAMEGLKEGVLSHYVLEMLQERRDIPMDERDYTKSSELTRTSIFLSVAAETSTLFQDHKYDDLITLAVDRDKAGTDFITKLREKKIPVIDARPPQREGQEKTDWNEILKQEKQLERDAPDNSRLAQARRKLERLRGEQDEAISRAYSHQALTNGQPVNDKRGGASFMRKQEQIEGQVFSKMDEIRQQEERVERLEHQQHLKEMGLNRQGSGLEMSVQNIPRIREELEKAKRGESFFTKATLERYQKELTRLEAISEQMGKTSIQPATQALIDEGLVNQWQKQPNTYFVKGLRRVALELTEEGEFQLSSQIKYHPKTDEERLKVDELLAKQRQENVGLTPSNQEKSISPQPEPIEKNQGEAGWLEKNWDNLTFSIENKKTVVIDPTSIDKTVEEKQTPDNQESITNTEENAGRTMSYEEVKRENEALTKELNNRIQSGELSIEFAPDFYLYDVFAKLGNSHPTKYLSDKKMEVLSPIHSLLTSIDDQTIDLYKKKGTPEQDSLYQALKPHQRTLGVDISTRFIGELAIAAYNTNKQIESLSSNSFGVYYDERTLDNLSQSIERMLEYPLIESGKRDFTYGFVTTPNTLYHYLEEQEGEVVLNRELLDNLMSRLDTQSIKIMEVSEEKEKSLEGGQETANNSEQNKKAETKLGDFPEESQVAAPLPEANVSQPLNDLSPSQTRSQPLLHFSINEDRKSIHKDNYHPISDKDLLKLNRYAPHLQNAAQWYLENVADSQVTYFYQDGADTNSLAISYNKESFMHLTGIYPYREGQTAEQTLLDFAAGNGQFDNILIANRGAAFDKLKVLPELPTMVDAESFYFGDLSDVEKFHTLNLDKAIRSNDQDVLLAFRTVDGTVLPASLMRLRQSLNLLLDQTNQEKIILGVFRERDGHIDQLSINEEYVKDKGAEMLSVLKNKQYEEVSKEIEQTISTVREEFEKSQEEEIKLEEQGYNKQELEHDADADGVSDEEELLLGTNPYDFRSKPGSKPEGEESLQADEVVLAAGSLAVADFIQNKDMAGLSRHLKEGIKEFLDSDKYKDYLTKMSQLNNYSNRNLRLILAQNPEAKQVASFKQWKENFGRHVKKGEKALRIFKPMTKIKKDENNQPILDKNGKTETVTFFGLVPVFDVSQTEGKEMPKAAEVKEQLTDLDYANLYRALMAIAKENDVSVRFEEMENNKHGYYSVPENQIVLRSNEMNKAQIIKTFLHEMAHAELHHADNPQKENLTRSTAELQAESVAYVVSSYYGIDTSEYSFNYLSGWSADKETLADLEAQLDIVQQEAKSLMVRMDQALEQLRLSQEKQTKRSFEQKLEKFKDQGKQAVEEHKQELKADAQSKKEKGFSK
ncbi:PBECR4 domain-containing protein [Streptococcus sp. 517s]